ncbi:hypothetical protein NDU88_004673 [Pleurodeles waltl]|uniref:Uncharacterized protein n=1 Tax=Pleurodeles waltl TaxID=8319 RepID=A0AAV7MCD1_PLEWA|nr:hypothetical protein NDU88_004673 [Pleurodeles waltl]
MPVCVRKWNEALYEGELAMFDESPRERANLQNKLGKFKSDLDKITKNDKKKESDLSGALARIKVLEALFHGNEAERNTSINEKRTLEGDVADLQAQLAKIYLSRHTLFCDCKNVLKKQMEKETLMRVDFKNRCQRLQEELDFQKNVYAKASSAKDRIRGLEEILTSERDKYRNTPHGKEWKMADMRERMQQQLNKYQDCLMCSWPWTWRSVLTGSCWKERKNGWSTH